MSEESDVPSSTGAGAEASDAIEGTRADVEPQEQGGDPACWAHLFCQRCGVMLDGSAHHPSCQSH